MSKRTIYVGLEYKDAFESVRSLILGNCFEGLPYAVKDDVITDGTYNYVLSNTLGNKAEQVKFAFEKDGATWFKALRGEKVNDDDAIWDAFRSNIIIEYHKRFSIIEYKQQSFTREEQDKAFALAQNCATKLVKTFFPVVGENIDVLPKKENLATENIYGVAMKIELSGGTGATVPVLGKVYFVRDGKVMRPVLSAVVDAIDQSIKSVVPDAQDTTHQAINETVVDNALDAMQTLIEDANQNFADYLCFADDVDKKAVEGMLEKLSHEAIELECSRVDVLYLAHFVTSTHEFNVFAQGKPLFTLKVGMGDFVTVNCASCNQKSLLVERNVLSYVDTNGNYQTALLDFSKDNFGLSAEVLEQIKATGEISKHFVPLKCKITNRICPTYKCASQLFTARVNNVEISCCCDCPYPDVVYTNSNGDKFYTPALVYPFDTDSLLSSDSVKTAYCSVCGRLFSASKIKQGACPTCAQADRDISQSAKDLYKKYKGCLPLSVRMNLTAKKGCFEDDEIILFVVGDKKYILNKLNVKDKGFVPAPTALRRRK